MKQHPRKQLAILGVSLLAVAALIAPGLAGAQGIPQVPSVSGGVPGGPGMSGMASMPSVTVPEVSVPQPTIPQPSPPSFNPPAVEPPSFTPPEAPSLPSFTPPTGENVPALGENAPALGENAPALGQGGNVERPGQGERPGPGQGLGQGQQLGSGELMSGAMQWGSGYSPFSQDSSGQWSRFGDRGSGNLPIEQFQLGEGQSWFQLGGFGTPTEAGGPAKPDNVTDLPAPTWHPDDLPEGMPSAPAAYDAISGVTASQEAAQDLVEQAAQNRDDTAADIQQAIDSASTNAQQAYDQFWQDYYAAVDYTAQAYYEAMMVSLDYMLEAYTLAVDYALVAVDYYLMYYDQYAAYCYFYPWDCYMYAYDVASGVYYDVSETSDQPVGTVEIGDVNVELTYPAPAPEPQPSAPAYEAVVVFANDQLGAVVEPLYAGAATEQTELMLQTLPQEMQGFWLSLMDDVSCEDYWALLNGGVASVAAGDCSVVAASVDPAAMSSTLSTASAGVYLLHANTAYPATASEALQLVTTVYPALTGLAFAEVTDIETGMAFTATAAGLGIDPATGASLSVPKVIYAGVVDVNGSPYVYTLVGVGQAYVSQLETGASAGT